MQRYKKRPIYWLFSSPKGSFNALIYMHRYTPSTVSTVLNEYLREFKAKLEASLQQQERLAPVAERRGSRRLRRRRPTACARCCWSSTSTSTTCCTRWRPSSLQIDLDDGVKANYPKFGAALKKIPGLEASDE